MADPSVPVFRGGSGSDCEEFVRAVYTYAFEKDKTEENKWMAAYAATRLSGKALRWYARQDNSVKLDWSALQVALLDQYPPSDDEDDVEPNVQLPPKTIPTPAAAAAPSAGVATSAAGSAPLSLVFKRLTISECNKARIRVEDTKGPAKGWISTKWGPSLSQLTTNSGEALHVKAEAGSGGTELRILNVNGWSRLCVQWSDATLDPLNISQYGLLKPCDAGGVPIKFSIFDASQGQCSDKVWDLDDAGVITLAWRGNGGKYPLYARLSPLSGGEFIIKSLRDKKFFGTPDAIKLVYEPIE